MKKSILIIVIMSLGLILMNAAGKKAIDFDAVDVDGNKIKLSDYQGKLVILDFWATWCKPCIKEIPTLLELNKQYSNDEFEIVSISLDRNVKHAKEFVKEYKMDWVHVIDVDTNNKLANMYGVRFIPDMFVIDKSGTVVARGLRGDRLKKKIKELVQ